MMCSRAFYYSNVSFVEASEVIGSDESLDEPDEEANDDDTSGDAGNIDVQASKEVKFGGTSGAIVVVGTLEVLASCIDDETDVEQTIEDIEQVEEESETFVLVSGDKGDNKESGPEQQSIEKEV